MQAEQGRKSAAREEGGWAETGGQVRARGAKWPKERTVMTQANGNSIHSTITCRGLAVPGTLFGTKSRKMELISYFFLLAFRAHESSCRLRPVAVNTSPQTAARRAFSAPMVFPQVSPLRHGPRPCRRSPGPHPGTSHPLLHGLLTWLFSFWKVSSVKAELCSVHGYALSSKKCTCCAESVVSASSPKQ